MRSCRGASPSPSGRGWPEGPGEGRLVKNVVHSGPHPPLRGTLSRRERDSLQPLPTTANVQTPVHRSAVSKPCGFLTAFSVYSSPCRLSYPPVKSERTRQIDKLLHD